MAVKRYCAIAFVLSNLTINKLLETSEILVLAQLTNQVE